MFRALILALLALTLTAGLAAQEVEVTATRFGNVRPPTGATGAWFETDVGLNVRPAPGSRGQMVSRVKVTVLLAFELAATGTAERRLEHYRAEAECVALEPGRANVRFYLPPELVKRDQLHGDPKYWGVELTVAGKAVPAGRQAYSTTLGTPEQRKNFQTRAGQGATANEGLLQPQFLTPFATEYPRATPTFVRRETR